MVTRFGRYSHTLSPGVGLTLPAPIDRVQKVNVEEIRNIDLGSAAEETLMLTGDQNIIDIAYQVRWLIRDPEQFLYELAEPEDTIRQVAESSMRQIVAQVSLQDAMGVKRGDIEARVQEEMQQTLDGYRSGRRRSRASRSGRPTRRPRSTMRSRKSTRPSRRRRATSTRPMPTRFSCARRRRATRPRSTRSMSSTSWRPA